MQALTILPQADAQTVSQTVPQTIAQTPSDAQQRSPRPAQLVMGLAAGYHYGDVRPFIASLRESGYTGHCVLFVSPTTRDIDRIQSHDVTCVLVDRDAYTASHGAEIPWNALRFFIYSDYLAMDHTAYTHILHADVRDIIFQRPPFMAFEGSPSMASADFAGSPSMAFTDFAGSPSMTSSALPDAPSDAPSGAPSSTLMPSGLTITLEDQRMTIGTCPYMTQWSCGHLGHHAWQAMAHHPISCSGTVIADRQSMLRYLKTMKAALLPHSPAKGMAGYDQAVHNHLLRNQALAPFHTIDNSGPILTLGYYDGMPHMDAKGTIFNDNGYIPHIVHQYDRIPELFKSIRARYAPTKRPKVRKPYFQKNS